MNKKELKKINKKYVCGTFTANKEFAKEFKKTTGKTATYNNIKEIKNIIDKEIDEGRITTKDEILKRRYGLIYELYIDDVETQIDETIKKHNITCNPVTVLKKYKEKTKKIEQATQELKEKNKRMKEMTELILAGELTDEEIEQLREEFFGNSQEKNTSNIHNNNLKISIN